MGLSIISKFFSFNKAKSSPVIQFVEIFTSDFLITSSKYFEVSISETNILASYEDNLNFSINLFFFSSGNSGIFFFRSLINSSVNSSGKRSGSGKYL